MAPIIGRLSFPFVVIDLAAGEEVACDGYRLIAVPTVHRGPSCGWSLVEDDRPGRFDVDEARRRGVPEGPLFGQLHRGKASSSPTARRRRRDRGRAPDRAAASSSPATRGRATACWPRRWAPTC